MIKALAFDTGGTVLDWHSGVSAALERVGARRQVDRDWAEITRSYRRRAMQTMMGSVSPAFNIDDVHRDVLRNLVIEHGLTAFTAHDQREICRAWHELDAWPDAAEGLARLRARYPVISLTILSVALIVNTSRKNRLDWDCVISCEMLGVYKPLPAVYRSAARLLGMRPDEVMLVATHNFDLRAARDVGFRTAFVHRPDEWGSAEPPDPVPDPEHDIVAAQFLDLAEQLGA